MAFADFPEQKQAVALLQRSLERGRLGHAYLFTGHQLSDLEALARTLVKVLDCRQPIRGANSQAIDCCDTCVNCRKIDEHNHADTHWLRPESKSRVITIDQVRDLIREMNLKPNDAPYKAGIIVAADRLNPQAANAFLKTLEEPPGKAVLILATTEPQRLLETILSRCLRLNFSGGRGPVMSPAQMDWLAGFGELAATEQKSLLSRYRLLGAVLKKLGEQKEAIEKSMTARSPLEKHDDVETGLRDKWEAELTAAIEAEYRLQRADLLVALQWWLRDVWLQSLAMTKELLKFPQLASTKQVAERVSARQAMENLRVMERTQRLLDSNVQEALALEVGLLKLQL
jgi:DNA polymerase-3 subunit delta'